MIGEFERYHGAALRELIVRANKPIKIETCDDLGRVNSYRIDGILGVHIKHSSKRLPPWQFTYLDDNILEIERLSKRCGAVWLIHVCGQDGAVALSLDEFWSVNPRNAKTTSFIRVDRDRNTMYRVNGTGGKLSRPKPRGLHYIFDTKQSPE
ncbi:hypothetical protein [uncultured Caulobacter sp.]|jgi:hypothetical protein|uniref:hypothetical protein n=1 Tax=uncultured Caulobacter sp. TaxID=158749 RepID=UPI00260CDD07|nr:hypothetical protein [uncultured Caulobacter sp.]